MLQRIHADNGVAYYLSPLLRNLGVPHGFSTRIGGMSPEPFDSLNLGNPNGCEIQDDHPRVEQNYQRFQAAIGCGDRQRCFVHQIHGGEVATVIRDRPFENQTKADALVSDDPSRALAMRVADCVPILLASDDGTRVAAIHAGWRGIIADVIPNALSIFMPHVAAIGPCIAFDAFEVGGEVLDMFAQKFGPSAPIRRTYNGKGHVDLREAAKMQLLRAGIAADRIDMSDRCTYRDADEFFSHRRDKGVTGRMAALILPAGNGR